MRLSAPGGGNNHKYGLCRINGPPAQKDAKCQMEEETQHHEHPALLTAR